MHNQFILLVEDDPCDQELIIHALRKSGIESEVAVARNGIEALEYLFGTGPHAGRNLSIMPALVLLDLHLPRVGGLEVLRRIRSNPFTRHLPVVVTTAAWNPEQILSGFRLQADGFICKSTDAGKLTEALGSMALDVLLGRHHRRPECDAIQGLESNAPIPALAAASAGDSRGPEPRLRRHPPTASRDSSGASPT